jgi:hypothetical protein
MVDLLDPESQLAIGRGAAEREHRQHEKNTFH